MKKLVLLLIVAIALPAFAADYTTLDYQDVMVDGQTYQCRGTTTFTSQGLSSLFSGWWAFEFPLIRFDLSDASGIDTSTITRVDLVLHCKTGSVPASGTLSTVVGIQPGNTWDPYGNNWDSTATHGTYYGGATGPVWSGVQGTPSAPWIQTGSLWSARSLTHQYGYLPIVGGAKKLHVDITALVVAWLNGGATNNGLYIGPNGPTVGGCPGGDNYSNVYGSSEYAAGLANPTVGPRLLIFVPEPATMLLLLGGAVTLIRRKR